MKTIFALNRWFSNFCTDESLHLFARVTQCISPCQFFKK